MPPKKAGMDAATMSKAQEEEMSSALIAQLLAEDACGGTDDYYAEYSNEHAYHAPAEDDGAYEDQESEDEYDPRKKGRGRGRRADGVSVGKRGRKRKATDTTAAALESMSIADATPPTPTDASANTTRALNSDIIPAAPILENTTGPLASTGVKPVSKKPRKPVPEGFNTGVYTDEEERRFLEGLDTYGREWSKLAAHIATRDANSIRSHAQKHFIKLFRDNVPLPEKVRESGLGYTLSGKPLDPNSSAARPYLMRTGACTEDHADKDKQMETNDLGVGGITDVVPVVGGCVNPCGSESGGMCAHKSIITATPVPKSAPTKKLTPPRTELVEKRDSAATPYDESGRTTYSKSKLRQARDQTSVNFNQLGKDDDPLTMVKCEPFAGKPGSSVTGCQPFEITVHSNVLLAMDFHAHLMTTEIIGFLAGQWDKNGRRMWIKEAYPCRSLNTGQNDVNVEMDPTSAIETRQAIEEKNMTVVGWYHSHPTFIPDPSLIDIENQRNYQVMSREEEVEPFVGAIVGPYDPRLPGSASVFNWFHVGNDQRIPIPKRLVYDLQEDTCIEEEHVDRLFQLLETYKHSPEKVNFADYWRQDAQESKLVKVIKSLGSRMPWVQKKMESEEVEADAFLERVQRSLKGW